MGFALAEWQLIDLFYNGVSHQYKEFLQQKIGLQHKSMQKVVTLDFDIAVDEIVTHLPKEADIREGNDIACKASTRNK